MFGFFKKKEKQKVTPKTLMGSLGIFYHSKTYPKIPVVVCSDGTEFGIEYDLSLERTTDTLFIRYSSRNQPLLSSYENDDKSYSYVPIILVRHIVEDLCGGIIGFKNVKEVDKLNKELNKSLPNRSVILPYRITNKI